jgi:hypothetical protein
MNPLLLFAFVLAPLGTVPQQEESVLATYDLRAVLPRWDASTSWSQSLLIWPVASPRQELPSIEGSLKYADLPSYELLDLLNQILGDDLRPGLQLVVDGSMLNVLAPPALQEQVRSILESLTSALGSTVSVRVDELTLAEGAGELGNAGLLNEDEAAKLVTALVGRGAQHKSYALELSAGRTALLDTHRAVPFLFDYDVEIAQMMMIYAPVMSETREGTRLALRGLAVPGGLALSAVYRRSELLGELGKIPLTLKGIVNPVEGGATQIMDGPDGVQSPEVLVSGLAFDTFLPDGKALALTLEGSLGKARTRELVLLRRTGGTMSSYVSRLIPRTNRTLIALHAELFRPARLSSAAEYWSDGQGGPQPSLVASLDGELSSFLLEWLKARFTVWRRFGPWILIVTDPAWDRDAPAQLDRLVKSLRPPAAPRTVSIDLRTQGAVVPVRIRVPLLDGSSAGLVLARGRTAVIGYDVEVANGAGVPDPFVGSVFDGLSLALSLQGTTIEARGLGQIFDTDIALLQSGYGLLGPIERPEPRVLRFDERLELPEGRPGPARIGGTSERGDQPGLALEITVSGAGR